MYCLSNKCNTKETDVCRRRSKEGLLKIARPKMISEYNRYMGGVDLADVQRLHCIMSDNHGAMAKHTTINHWDQGN